MVHISQGIESRADGAELACDAAEAAEEARFVFGWMGD